MTSDLAVLDGGYALWHVTYGVTCIGKYRRKPTGPSSNAVGEGVAGGGVAGQQGASKAVSMDYPTFPEIK